MLGSIQTGFRDLFDSIWPVSRGSFKIQRMTALKESFPHGARVAQSYFVMVHATGQAKNLD
jgi:hypothetical protein